MYHVKKALTAPFKFEAKYKAFNQLPFKEICLGIKLKSANVTNYIRIDLQQQHQSLLNLFQGDHKSIEDYVDSREWLSLIPKVSNQIQLCKQGFNAETPNINSVRLGILGNEDSCTSNWVDLWIGIGGQPLYCTQKYSYIPTVSHCCMVECKDRGDKAMAYVFVKWLIEILHYAEQSLIIFWNLRTVTWGALKLLACLTKSMFVRVLSWLCHEFPWIYFNVDHAITKPTLWKLVCILRRLWKKSLAGARIRSFQLINVT